MKLVNWIVEYNDEDIAYFNRVNPTLFDIAVMINEKIGDIFYRHEDGEPLRYGMKMEDVIRVDLEFPGACPIIVLFGYGYRQKVCSNTKCSFSVSDPCCLEYTWKEITGQIPEVDRRFLTVKERIKMLAKQKSIKVV